MKDKKVDINQRIPLVVLQNALINYLNDSYDPSYVEEQLRVDFKGENRLRKSLRIVEKIIVKSPLDEYMKDNKEEILLALKRKDDRGLILISLLNSTYIFSYDTLRSFGKILTAQSIVNTGVILKLLKNIYGGNRATENAFYSVVPMFVESGILLRPQTGLYALNSNFQVTSDIASNLYTESFKVNSPFESISDYHLEDAYFLFSK